MEEKQIEIKQEAAPAQEPKRPLLLSVIVIGAIACFVFVITCCIFAIVSSIYVRIFYAHEPLIMHSTGYLSGLFYILICVMVLLIGIYILLKLWAGYKWARLGIVIILGLLMIILAFDVYNFSFSLGWTLKASLFLLLFIIVFLYILLDKNVKAYCRK